VRHPERSDWGLGQVQSVISGRITVNFENAGKVVIDGSRILLTPDSGRQDTEINESHRSVKGQ